MPSLTQNTPGTPRGRYQVNFFAMNADHNKLFNNFCKIQAQNLKTFAGRFQVVIHFHLGHPWQKTLSNSFTELVWCLNKKISDQYF